MSYVVAALYHFVDLAEPGDLCVALEGVCRAEGVQGTLLVASEGINGTISGSRQGIDRVMAFLRSQPGLAELESKESASENRPFLRLKVRQKDEIVTMRVDGVRPADKVGEYVEPKDWNALLKRDDVLVIDTRNDFEYRVGHFDGAVDPETTSFCEFPEYVQRELDPAAHKAVAMYCTGGIRCEKATSYMLDQGFQQVYHLKGGILRYLETVPPEESLWTGECFVFDQRVSVTHGLETGTYQLCYGCQSPLSAAQRDSEHYEFGVSCPYCIDQISPQRLESLRERGRQVAIASERGIDHLGELAMENERRRLDKLRRKDEDRERTR